MALTVLKVKNAKPGRHSDGRGLCLLVKRRKLMVRWAEYLDNVPAKAKAETSSPAIEPMEFREAA